MASVLPNDQDSSPACLEWIGSGVSLAHTSFLIDYIAVDQVNDGPSPDDRVKYRPNPMCCNIDSIAAVSCEQGTPRPPN